MALARDNIRPKAISIDLDDKDKTSTSWDNLTKCLSEILDHLAVGCDVKFLISIN